jgi:transposase InsO family protein
VYTTRGLVTYYILLFIDIASRSVHIAGTTSHPDNRWMTQIARNVTDAEDGFLRGTRYLILDRDTKYSDEFRSVLVHEGIHLIRLPPRAPNLKAFAERFVRSIRSECLSRMIFFGQASLQHAISHFMAHYHCERNHQGLANQLLRAAPYRRPISPGIRCWSPKSTATGLRRCSRYTQLGQKARWRRTSSRFATR